MDARTIASQPYEWLKNLDEAEAEEQWYHGLLTAEEFAARFDRVPDEPICEADMAEVAAIRAAMQS